MASVIVKDRERQRDRRSLDLDWDEESRTHQAPLVRRYKYRDDDQYSDLGSRHDTHSRFDDRERPVSRERIVIRDRSVGRRRNMHIDAMEDGIEVIYDKEPDPYGWDDRSTRSSRRVPPRLSESRRDFDDVEVDRYDTSPRGGTREEEVRITERSRSPSRRGHDDYEEIRVIERPGEDPEVIVTERRTSPARSVRRGPSPARSVKSVKSVRTVRREASPARSARRGFDEEEVRIIHRHRDDFPSRHSTRSRKTVEDIRITERDDSPSRRSVKSRRTEIDETRSVTTRRDSPSRYSTIKEETIIRERSRSPTAKSVRSTRRGDMEEIRIVTKKREDGEEEEKSVRIRHTSRDRQTSVSPSPTRKSVKSVKSVRREVRYDDSEDDEDDYRSYAGNTSRYSRSEEYLRREQPRIIIKEKEEEVILPDFLREQPPQQVMLVTKRYDDERVENDQQVALVRRDDRREDREDDVYYEKHVKKIERPRSRHRSKHRSRSRRRRHSNDEWEHRRKVTVYEEEVPRDRSRHRRRLLEGALGGLVAGELVRRNRKKAGEDPGSRVGTVLGYGALGAIGGEAVDRYQNWNEEKKDRERDYERDYDRDDDRDDDRYDNRDRDRDRDRSRDRGRRSRSRGGRDRENSLSRGQILAGAAALAAAGVAAYTANRRNSKKGVEGGVIEENPRLGRSQTRLGSDDMIEGDDGEVRGKHEDPTHQRTRMAQAGLAGAAIAALASRSRSRSRKGSRKDSRSKSTVRDALPILATGLGSAAAAGLYERQRAKKEAKEGRARSRSASAPPLSRDPRDDDTALISYGDGPVSTTDDMALSRRGRAGSRANSFRASPYGSPDPYGRDRSTRRSRSGSRARGIAGAAAAGGIAALAASEASKLRDNRRAERERRRAARREAEQAGIPYSETAAYADQNNYPPPPPGPVPGSNYVPPQDGQMGAGYNPNYPPPTGYPPQAGTPGPGYNVGYPSPIGAPGLGYDPGYPPPPPPAQPGYMQPPGQYSDRGYNPAEYGPTNGPTLPPETPPVEHSSGPTDYYHENPRSDREREYGGKRNQPNSPENVSRESAPEHLASGASASFIQPDGINAQHNTLQPPNGDNYLSNTRGDVTPRATGGSYSPGLEPITTPLPMDTSNLTATSGGKSVQFADDQAHSDGEIERRPAMRRQATGFHPEVGDLRRSGKRATSPASDETSETVELPARFDRQGRRLFREERHDSIGDAVEAFLNGRTSAGRSFNRAVDGWLSGIGGGGNGSGGGNGWRDGRDRRDRR